MPTPAGSDRRCGKCTACCVYLPVPAGIVGPRAKPAGQRCPYQCRAGCNRYATRPRMCADFLCVWLADPAWPSAWRPDCSGLLCLRAMLDVDLPAALVYEIRDRALESPVAAPLMESLKQSVVLMTILDFRGRRRCVRGTYGLGRVA